MHAGWRYCNSRLVARTLRLKPFENICVEAKGNGCLGRNRLQARDERIDSSTTGRTQVPLKSSGLNELRRLRRRQGSSPTATDNHAGFLLLQRCSQPPLGRYAAGTRTSTTDTLSRPPF